MFNWHIKESPILSMLGLGGGIGSKLSGGSTAAIEASGGSTFEVGDFRFHVYNSSTPSPTANFSIDVLHPDPTNNVFDFLVVGGGGGAGGGDNAYGGGGGGGGLIWRPAKPISSTGGPYPISVGSGGGGQPIDNSNAGNGSNGGDTTIGSSPDPIYFIAKGGGGGASAAGYSFGNAGSDGGSGGGGAGGGPGPKTPGSATQPGQPGESGTYGHGSNGRPQTPFPGPGDGGGGGGAGSSGGVPADRDGIDGYQVPEPFLPPSVPAPMASAISPITTPSPEFRYFSGGGSIHGPGTGGLGGGGDASSSDGQSSAPAASNGIDGRGGGGASNTSNNPRSYAGDGGDGIVLIKYKFQNY